MEELEDPTERLKETMEQAEEQREKWTLHVALSTAIIAVLAAIAGLLGNHHSNEALLEQIKSSDQFGYYQSKSIKSEISNATAQILEAVNKPLPASNQEKMARYEKEKAEILVEAQAAQKSSEEHLARHVIFSRSVTIFQIAIAISAIAILTKKKIMWYISMLAALAASVFLVLGII